MFCGEDVLRFKLGGLVAGWEDARVKDWHFDTGWSSYQHPSTGLIVGITGSHPPGPQEAFFFRTNPFYYKTTLKKRLEEGWYTPN